MSGSHSRVAMQPVPRLLWAILLFNLVAFDVRVFVVLTIRRRCMYHCRANSSDFSDI